MSSGMNRAQAEEYAKTMTYRQAIGNIRTGKGIMYRKATMIKLHELAEIADKLVLCKDCKNYSIEGKITQFSWCNALEMPTDEQRFCSYGERSE